MEIDAWQLAKFIKASIKSKFIDSFKKNPELCPVDDLSYCDEFRNDKNARALTLNLKNNNKFLFLVIKVK